MAKRRLRTAGLLASVGAWTLLALSSTVLVPAEARADTVSSAVTVTAADLDSDAAHAPFPDLAVTVSQTEELQAQGIRVSWTGGKKSTAPSGQNGGEDFLQIAQCWGTDPEDATRPDRTTCQYGGLLTPGSTRDGFRSDGTVASKDSAYTAPGDGFVNPTYTSIPFRSATGPVVASFVDHVKVPGVDPNTNAFFTQLTTNEVSWVGSGSDGTGSVQFEVQTAAQAPGLGCGTPVTGAGGVVSGSSCWLVVIPRGTADNGESSITTSGLFWDSWKHSIAVKLGFKPLGVRCALGAVERQVAGSELLALAVASWQPTLCGASGGSAYTMIAGSESDAAAAANTTATAPLALTSRPLGTAGDGLKYAPVGLSAVTISFSVDRVPAAGPDVPQSVKDKARLAFTSMNLTPRLVAKLLTNSYLDSLPYFADRSHLAHGADKNPRNVTFDPDFLAVNPDWADQAIVSPAVADVLLPQGRSDAAWALWAYVLADPDAAAFLAGAPDPYGMVVNPWSSTDPAVNKTGAGLQLPRDNFPKADPVEQAADTPPGPGAINLVAWRPYVSDFNNAAYLALRGDGKVLGGWDPSVIPARYAKSSRSLPGSQAVLALTDSSSAARYQVFSASLKNQAGQFVAPTSIAMTAAAAAMTPTTVQPQVVEYNPTSTAARTAVAAYPLTLPIYAAANPGRLDPTLRASYAAFVKYAATDGQVPGESLGQLPAGYASIPDAWRAQSLTAAQSIATGQVDVPATPPKTTTSTTSTTSSSNSGSAPSAPVPAPNPTATGTLAPALSASKTPDDPDQGGLAATLPAVIIVALLAWIATAIVSRRRRLL
ncbi:hypothetical protein BH09ACT5_BH09ACT5_18590 [soil metagenome]